MAVFAHLSPERRDAIDGHLKQDPRMFGSRDCLARTAAGSRATWKAFRPIFKTDGTVETAVVDRDRRKWRGEAGGSLIARDIVDWRRAGDRTKHRRRRNRHVVGRALALGLVPAMLLCIAVGVVLSARAADVSSRSMSAFSAFVAGNLRERLQHRNADDPFSKLAMIVNGMLDEMETLFQSLAGVGSDIAHDLRTPLVRG